MVTPSEIHRRIGPGSFAPDIRRLTSPGDYPQDVRVLFLRQFQVGAAQLEFSAGAGILPHPLLGLSPLRSIVGHGRHEREKPDGGFVRRPGLTLDAGCDHTDIFVATDNWGPVADTFLPGMASAHPSAHRLAPPG